LYETRTHSVSGKATVSGSPLAVLIDRWTASAAEIVAAALRDNERAILVGRRTYGKASVQTLLDLSNGGAIKLTTATYLTPNGVDINGQGIRPDVRALDDPLTRRDEALAAAKKALLEQFA
jgi:carboxyl-terminal processing protease